MFRVTRVMLVATLICLVVIYIFPHVLAFSSSPLVLSAEENQYILDNPVVKYGPDTNFPPFEFRVDDVNLGIVADYLDHIASITGLTFETVYYDKWTNAVDAVQGGTLDIVFATESEARAELMLFTDPLIRVPDVLIVRSEAPDHLKLEDLSGKLIGVMEGFLTTLEVQARYPDYSYVQFDDIDRALRALSFGEVDVAIINLGTASYSIEKQRLTNLKAATAIEVDPTISFAITKDKPLLRDILNKAIAAISAEEKQAIERKWIEIEFTEFWKRPIVWQVILVIAVILLGIWVWIYSLNRKVHQKTENIRVAQQALESVIDHIPHIIYVRNAQGKYVMANLASAQYYGVQRDQMLGATHDALYPEGDSGFSKQIKERDQAVIHSGEIVTYPEVLLKDPRGNERIFYVIKRPIKLVDVPGDCVLTVAMDISEQVRGQLAIKEQEEALRSAEQRLSELDKKATLGSLVAGITHEINNPIGISVTALSHIKMEFEAFKKAYRSDALTREQLVSFLGAEEEAIEILDKNMTRAVDMITSFKRMSVDQLSGARVSFNLCDTIQHVIHSLSYEIKRKGVHVKYHCAEPLVLDSYPGSYSQVMTNLIMNSIIHGFEQRQKGLITIDVQAHSELIHIEYRDDGVGMSPDLLEKVWQPYFTTKRDRGGSGLGMQIIYNIVVRTLKGQITFTSTLGEGVRCIIIVPQNIDL